MSNIKTTQPQIKAEPKVYTGAELDAFGDFLSRYKEHKVFPTINSEGDVINTARALYAYGAYNAEKEIKSITRYVEFFEKMDQWLAKRARERNQDEMVNGDYHSALKAKMQVQNTEEV